MDSVSDKGGKMVESDEQPERDSGGGAAMAALHQCELIQNMIEISISSLQGLRTKCAASNDLTQQEIRTLEVIITQRMLKNSRPNCSVMQAFATEMGCRLSLSLPGRFKGIASSVSSYFCSVQLCGLCSTMWWPTTH